MVAGSAAPLINFCTYAERSTTPLRLCERSALQSSCRRKSLDRAGTYGCSRCIFHCKTERLQQKLPSTRDNAGHLERYPASWCLPRLPITPSTRSGAIAAPVGVRSIYREVGVADRLTRIVGRSELRTTRSTVVFPARRRMKRFHSQLRRRGWQLTIIQPDASAALLYRPLLAQPRCNILRLRCASSGRSETGGQAQSLRRRDATSTRGSAAAAVGSATRPASAGHVTSSSVFVTFAVRNLERVP